MRVLKRARVDLEEGGEGAQLVAADGHSCSKTNQRTPSVQGGVVSEPM